LRRATVASVTCLEHRHHALRALERHGRRQQVGGDALLDREITLEISGLNAGAYVARHRRLDHEHSDLNASWDRIGGRRAWPDDGDWRELAASDGLTELTPGATHATASGTLVLSFEMPMPAVSLLELTPSDAR
jgi:xylan 1,4-beta-xylosidase